MLVRRIKPTPWPLEALSLGERPALYALLVAHRADDGGLDDPQTPLPDEAAYAERHHPGTTWAAGGYDGLLGHHATSDPQPAWMDAVLTALRALLADATPDTLAACYDRLCAQPMILHADALLARVLHADFDAERLYRLARWLAERAPDREPVKFALALLGLFQTTENRPLLLTFGAHEAFTPFAAVALLRTERDPEPLLLDVAQRVHGWGRIHLVERLAATAQPATRAWLLRAGYRNTVSWGYTARACAEAGGLLDALRADDPDDAVLTAAVDLLVTLVEGRDGPGDGIHAYADGPAAAERYLALCQTREPRLDALRLVAALQPFLADAATLPDGWPERRDRLHALLDALLNDPALEIRLREGLASPDAARFAYTAAVAEALGADLWDVYFDRAQTAVPDWAALARTDDPARRARAQALAHTLGAEADFDAAVAAAQP